MKAKKTAKIPKIAKLPPEIKTTGKPHNPLTLNDLAIEGVVTLNLIKYNLYLLSKAIIFSSVFAHHSYDEAVELTNKAIADIDLANKKE